MLLLAGRRVLLAGTSGLRGSSLVAREEGEGGWERGEKKMRETVIAIKININNIMYAILL